MDDLNSLTSLELPVTLPDTQVGYEEMLNAIADVVNRMLNDNPDLLFSYLYRLDVDEAKIKFALSPLAETAPHIGLANLIIERQKQRIRTRQEYSEKVKK